MVEAVVCVLGGVYFAFLMVCLAGLRRALARASATHSVGHAEEETRTRDNGGTPLPTVSVIVPARNEASNIGACVSSILENDYPSRLVEIVVVDDNSDDETSGIVRELASGRENEYVVRLVRPPRAKDKDPAPKKTAIDAGIRATDGSILILTDADCVVGPCWIRTVVSCFDTDVGMVSGPVGYTRDGTWFGDLQRLEFAGMVAIGGGSIEMGWPLLCSGANIAYRREAFESIGGFEGIDHIGSGDDDLLMEKMHEHTPLRIRFCADPAALTWTAPSRTFGRFVQQRIRWASKGRLYASASKRLLLLAIFVFLGFVAASPVVAYLWPDLLPVVVAAWAAKIVADALILSSAVNLISGKKLLGLVPVGEIVHAAYVVAVGLAGTAGGYSWKGRRLLQ